MKIAYVLPYNWGGMIHYTAELANAVSKYADVAVLGSKDIPENYFCKNIELISVFGNLNFSTSNLKAVLSCNNISALLSLKKIQLIRKVNPQIIHFTTPLFHIPLFVKYYRLDKQYSTIYTVHSPNQKDKFLMEKINYIDSLINNLITYDKIIVHSQRDKEQMMLDEKFSEKDIVVIPHGIYDFFSKHQRANKSKAAILEKNCVLFFGHIKKYKGLEYLIRAIPYISKEIPSIKVIIAGEGDLSYYYDLINNKCPYAKRYLEIHNNFIPDQDVSLLFQRASLVVVPYSQMTGQSGIIAISLAFGKPVVATNVWAFDEVLKDGETGYLVPPKNPKALARAIIEILNNDNLREYMRNNAYEKARELSWDNIAKKHMEVYENVILAKARRINFISHIA